MTELRWEITEHSTLGDSERLGIARLKDQHWIRGVESQIAWLMDNTEAEDRHLMGFDENGVIRAYLNLNEITVVMDETPVVMIGVGGVCVDKSLEHSGLGRVLMAKAGAYLAHRQRTGILLCRERVQGFYEKCGWTLLSTEQAVVQGAEYTKRIMTRPCDMKKYGQIIIPRNF